MLFYHLSHLLIPGHHDIAHHVAGLCHIHMAVILELCRIKKLIPEINILILPRSLEIIKKLIETAGLDAIKDWPEGSFIFFVNMRKEHSL